MILQHWQKTTIIISIKDDYVRHQDLNKFKNLKTSSPTAIGDPDKIKVQNNLDSRFHGNDVQLYVQNIFQDPFQTDHDQLLGTFRQTLNINRPSAITCFQEIIKHFHAHKRRSFAWREQICPYRVVISEIMLQQTQTDRVAPKFDAFVKRFESFETLATASFHDVLKYWKGLGYNRRAMALQKIAQIVTHEFNGLLPNKPEILETFPGIGKATASSITTFAFNTPTVFIETNIRTVFIYFFFQNQINIHDKELEPLVNQTVDQNNPREWYYALMDYGVMLKKTVGNVSRLSSHYAKQSRFEGSDRQIRGMILQALLDHKTITNDQLFSLIDRDQQRTQKILNDLMNENLVKKKNNLLILE
jgi:A/G-specific adenine glycosylase